MVAGQLWSAVAPRWQGKSRCCEQHRPTIPSGDFVFSERLSDLNTPIVSQFARRFLTTLIRMPPLLSICVPTYNRSAFLRVMLQALLPQAQAAGDDVEVWVLDNDSVDSTPAVIQESRQLGPFQYHRNHEVNNIVKGPSYLATGEFVWVLGDHNLMRPGALKRVLSALKANRRIDVFYVNFRCATYPEHWPDSAMQGYDGPFSYLGNQEISDGPVSCWMDLISEQSALCTQVYAHVVRTSVWRGFWRGRQIPAPYTSGLTIYPHTWMIATTLFGKPATCVTDPVITIFNGAQSWGDTDSIFRVYAKGFPDLLALYARMGLPEPTIRRGRAFCSQQIHNVVCRILQQPSTSSSWLLLGLLTKIGVQNIWLWPAIWRGFMDAQSCWTSRSLRRSGIALERWQRYFFHNWKLARWYHRHRFGQRWPR